MKTTLLKTFFLLSLSCATVGGCAGGGADELDSLTVSSAGDGEKADALTDYDFTFKLGKVIESKGEPIVGTMRVTTAARGFVDVATDPIRFSGGSFAATATLTDWADKLALTDLGMFAVWRIAGSNGKWNAVAIKMTSHGRVRRTSIFNDVKFNAATTEFTATEYYGEQGHATGTTVLDTPVGKKLEWMFIVAPSASFWDIAGEYEYKFLVR